MSDEIRNLLKAGINRTLDETRDTAITQATIMVYGKGKWKTVGSILEEWQEEGFLQIVKEPKTAAPGDICIRMKSYIGKTSPIPGFLE